MFLDVDPGAGRTNIIAASYVGMSMLSVSSMSVEHVTSLELAFDGGVADPVGASSLILPKLNVCMRRGDTLNCKHLMYRPCF